MIPFIYALFSIHLLYLWTCVAFISYVWFKNTEGVHLNDNLRGWNIYLAFYSVSGWLVYMCYQFLLFYNDNSGYNQVIKLFIELFNFTGTISTTIVMLALKKKK